MTSLVCTITNFSFIKIGEADETPLVSFTLYLKHKESDLIIVISYQDLGKVLSEKFKFQIVGKNSYNFTGLVGQDALILKDDSGYHFINYA